MKRLSIALVILCLSGFAHAGLYSWVDENGVRHYSNTAPPEDGGMEVKETTEKKNSGTRDQAQEELEAIRDKKWLKDEMKSWEEDDKAEEAERLKNRRESIAQDFFIRAENASEDEGYGPKKRAAFLKSIAKTCLKCKGKDIDKAEEYYELADTKVNEILDDCEAKVQKGSVAYTKVTFGKREWSRKCVNRKIREARVYKSTGDRYMCTKKR